MMKCRPLAFVTTLFVASTLLAVPSLSAQAPAQSPDALAKALQARYQGVRDFSADFVQSYRGGVLKTQTQEKGTVSVKKPGKMRWAYSSSDRKELVSDGSKIYWYMPTDKQLSAHEMSSGS